MQRQWKFIRILTIHISNQHVQEFIRKPPNLFRTKANVIRPSLFHLWDKQKVSRKIYEYSTWVMLLDLVLVAYGLPRKAISIWLVLLTDKTGNSEVPKTHSCVKYDHSIFLNLPFGLNCREKITLAIFFLRENGTLFFWNNLPPHFKRWRIQERLVLNYTVLPIFSNTP